MTPMMYMMRWVANRQDIAGCEMSLHNGTAAETERKRMLENEGHIILNLGQNQYGDLEDVCHDIIIEVKTSKHSRRDLSRKEKDQMTNLLMLRPYRTIRYDIRFSGNGHHGPVWQTEHPDRVLSSFKLSTNINTPPASAPKISKSVVDKNRKAKHGIHTEKKKDPEKVKAMEKVKA